MRRAPAHIHRVRAGRRSRGVTTPVSFVYLPVSLTGPGPSGSPEPTRLCRGCSHPHQRLPARAASSFTPPLRRPRRRRSPTSIRSNSTSWRITSARTGSRRGGLAPWAVTRPAWPASPRPATSGRRTPGCLVRHAPLPRDTGRRGERGRCRASLHPVGGRIDRTGVRRSRYGGASSGRGSGCARARLVGFGRSAMPVGPLSAPGDT